MFNSKDFYRPGRTGKPDKYEKVPDTKASKVQVGRAGQTNTKSFECKSLKSSSRTGRPDEYEKAPGTKLPMYKPKRQAVKTMYPINYNIELITHMNYKVFDS